MSCANETDTADSLDWVAAVDDLYAEFNKWSGLPW